VPSPLDNLTGPGKALRNEPPDAKEFAGLKRSGMARLSDAANIANSLEGRFDLAYNAAHTLGLDAAVWGVLAKCHEVRNLSEYEGDLNVDERLLADLLVACKAVRVALEKLPLPK
jgi:hypothetical protein